MLDFLCFTPSEISALLLSLKVALCCTIIICIPAILIAWVLAKKSFFGKSLIDSLVHLPLVLPPVVPGFLLLLALGKQGFIGNFLYTHFGVSIAFTWIGAVLASAVMAFPLLVRSARLGISQVDHRLELAAASLGANPIKVFFTITLPLSFPGVLTGLVLAFSRSLGEFGATITFVGNIENVTRTLPLAIYSFTQVPGGDAPAIRLVVLSMLLALGALMLSDHLERIANKKVGNIHD